MTTHELRNLRINRVDKIAAEQSGLPPQFYAIKRCYGDDEAESYFHNIDRVANSRDSKAGASDRAPDVFMTA